MVSLPEKSKAYASILRLNIFGNEDLIEFPSAEQFVSVTEISVHYPYHCCQFKHVGARAEKVRDNEFQTRENKLTPGGITYGKFVTLTPFKKIGLNQ